jgi:hypothetical protein
MRQEAGSKRSPWKDWVAWAVTVWAVCLLAVSIRVAVAPARRTVYLLYPEAGRQWRASEDVYQQPLGYRYSPPVTVFFAAWSLLPDAAGAVLWRLASASVFLGGLAWWARDVLPRPLTRRQQGLLFLLVVPLSLGSFNNGQVNFLMAGLHLTALAAVRRSRWQLASACLVLSCLFKVYPIALALLLLLVYPRKLGPRLAVTMLVGLALPFLTQAPGYVAHQYGDWFVKLAEDDRSHLPLTEVYRDMALLLRLWEVPISHVGYLAVQLFAGVVIAVVCLVGCLAGVEPRRLLTTLFALASCWMMLFGPTTESSTFVLLAPALAWALLECWAWPCPRWWRWGVTLSFGLLLSTVVRAWFPDAAHYHALGIHPVGTLLFLLVVLAQALTDLARAERGSTVVVRVPRARAA